MVVQTKEREILQVGRPAGFPWLDVMGVGEGDVGATREPTMSIPSHDLPSLGIGGCSSGPALVHGVTHVVVDGDGDGGVTRDLADGRSADQAGSLELAGQIALIVEEGGHGGMDDDEIRALCRGPLRRSRGCRGTDDLQEGVAEPLVPGGLAIGRNVLRTSLEATLGLGEGLGRELDGHGAALLVEAQVTALMGGRGGCGGRTSGGRHRPARARCRPGLGRITRVVLGRGHVGDGADLVQGQLAGAQRPDESGDVQRLLAEVGEAPRRGCRDAEAFGRPVLRARRPLGAVGLAPGDLAQTHGGPALGGRHLTEEPIEAIEDLGVRQGGDLGNQVHRGRTRSPSGCAWSLGAALRYEAATCSRKAKCELSTTRV